MGELLAPPGQPKITGSRDDYGIASVRVAWFATDLAEAMFGPAPNPTGLTEAVGKRTFSDWADGNGYLVSSTFEGIAGNASEEELVTYEFDSSFAENRIEAHPRIVTLIKKYGGQVQDDGTIIWPLTLPQVNRGAGSGLSTGKSSTDKNPMFGNASYVELQAVFRINEVRRELPARYLSDIGKLVESLPGGHPTPPGRNWLTMPFRSVTRGNVAQITRELLLGPPGGWPKDIYELITL